MGAKVYSIICHRCISAESMVKYVWNPFRKSVFKRIFHNAMSYDTRAVQSIATLYMCTPCLAKGKTFNLQHSLNLSLISVWICCCFFREINEFVCSPFSSWANPMAQYASHTKPAKGKILFFELLMNFIYIILYLSSEFFLLRTTAPSSFVKYRIKRSVFNASF